MTVYSDDPVSVAKGFYKSGAKVMHVVDLDGAKEGRAVNAEVIRKIVSESGMFVEVGGGIRNAETVKDYLDSGVGRVILGTAALRDHDFLRRMLGEYGERVAVGVDIKNGNVAVSGWLEDDGISYRDFLAKMQEYGVKTIICTDITKDGAMQGTNRELYREISNDFSFNVIASGGVSSIDDVRALSEMNLYGAIIGKALYNGGVELAEAVRIADGIES